MADRVYERRLSGEEAAEKYVFITKDALNKFPPLDASFSLMFQDQGYKAVIAAVPCDCIGTPHEHYHLRAAELFEKTDLRKGSHVVVLKIDQSNYQLETSG